MSLKRINKVCYLYFGRIVDLFVWVDSSNVPPHERRNDRSVANQVSGQSFAQSVPCQLLERSLLTMEDGTVVAERNGGLTDFIGCCRENRFVSAFETANRCSLLLLFVLCAPLRHSTMHIFFSFAYAIALISCLAF